MEKKQSLMLEIETIHAQIEKMRESDAAQMQKYHSLAPELEYVGKQQPAEQSTCTNRRNAATFGVGGWRQGLLARDRGVPVL
jgi:hypothetical protein